MEARKPPTGNPTAYTNLDQLLSAPQAALQDFREALNKGGRADLQAAIKRVKKHGLDPDQVVIRCASSKQVFWYQPAAMVLASARPSAHLLLRGMLDQGMDITRHRCGSPEPGSFRPLVHAFVQGWAGARAASVRKTDPNSLEGMLDLMDETVHRLDSRGLLKLFAEQQLDWAEPSSTGQTILHQAMRECKSGDLRTIVLLGMEKGVDPSMRDHKGKDAIELGRLRLAAEVSAPDRENLEFLLAEMSQAGMANRTGHSIPGPSRSVIRI